MAEPRRVVLDGQEPYGVSLRMTFARIRSPAGATTVVMTGSRRVLRDSLVWALQSARTAEIVQSPARAAALGRGDEPALALLSVASATEAIELASGLKTSWPALPLLVVVARGQEIAFRHACRVLHSKVTVCGDDIPIHELVTTVVALSAGKDCPAFGCRAPWPSGSDPFAALSPREYHVLSLLSDGLPARSIARVLGIKTPTVRAHLANARGKLGASSQLEAVALVRRRFLECSLGAVVDVRAFSE